jgi:hypothetical protein
MQQRASLGAWKVARKVGVDAVVLQLNPVLLA